MSFTTLLLWLAGLIYFGSCIWLVIVILLQEGKSGGFGAGDSAGAGPGALSDSLGAGAAGKSLYRMTVGTAVVFAVLAVLLTHLGNSRSSGGGRLNLPSASEQTPSSLVETAPATPEEGTGETQPE